MLSSSSPSYPNQCGGCIVMRQPCLKGCGFREVFPPDDKDSIENFILIRKYENMDEVHLTLLRLKSVAEKTKYVDSLKYQCHARDANIVRGAHGQFQDSEDSVKALEKKAGDYEKHMEVLRQGIRTNHDEAVGLKAANALLQAQLQKFQNPAGTSKEVQEPKK